MSAREVRRCAAVFVSVGAGFLAGGCGQLTRVPGGRTVQITLLEYRLRPNDVAARAGRLTLLVRNVGRLTHNLAVSGGAHTLASTAPIPPGDSATLKLTLAAGTYTLASTIQSDETLGARGTLHVSRG